MTVGLKANADGSGAIQVGGSDAITISAALNTTFAGTAAVPTGTLYPIVSGTAVASTSGTSINFTDIPSWVKRITIMFQAISLNGSSIPMVQIGAGTTPETTGYLGSVSSITTGVATESSTTGFKVFTSGSGAAATTISGAMTITLLTGSSWIVTGTTARTDAAQSSVLAYSKTITGTLGVVRITSVNGTDTFDAGSINLIYE